MAKIKGFIINDTTYDLQDVDAITEDSEKWGTKQDTLVSGQNIKSINSNSILGSGNMSIEGGGSTEKTPYNLFWNETQKTVEVLNNQIQYHDNVATVTSTTDSQGKVKLELGTLQQGTYKLVFKKSTISGWKYIYVNCTYQKVGANPWHDYDGTKLTTWSGNEVTFTIPNDDCLTIVQFNNAVPVDSEFELILCNADDYMGIDYTYPHKTGDKIIWSGQIDRDKIELALSQDVLYFSSSTGDDNNLGNTPARPKKTPDAYIAQGNHTILLKAGDIFEGPWVLGKNIRIAAYGGTQRPILSGVRKSEGVLVADPEHENVWICELGNHLGYVMVEDFDSDWDRRSLYKYEYVDGVKVGPPTPSKQGEFFCADGDDELHIYDERNVAGKHVFYTIGSHGISSVIGASDMGFCEIDGLEIYGWGCHGIDTGTGFDHITIKNCFIHVIGGGHFSEQNGYGNGIQFWSGSTEDIYCTNNIVCDCWDTGITIQYPTGDDDDLIDYGVIANNYISHAWWPLESYGCCRNEIISNNIVAYQEDVTAPYGVDLNDYYSYRMTTRGAWYMMWEEPPAGRSVVIRDNLFAYAKCATFSFNYDWVLGTLRYENNKCYSYYFTHGYNWENTIYSHKNTNRNTHKANTNVYETINIIEKGDTTNNWIQSQIGWGEAYYKQSPLSEILRFEFDYVNIPSFVSISGISATPSIDLYNYVDNIWRTNNNQISVTLKPANASMQVCSFESDDTSIATVNSNGVITATGVGTATITSTAWDDRYSAETEVNCIAERLLSVIEGNTRSAVHESTIENLPSEFAIIYSSGKKRKTAGSYNALSSDDAQTMWIQCAQSTYEDALDNIVVGTNTIVYPLKSGQYGTTVTCYSNKVDKSGSRKSYVWVDKFDATTGWESHASNTSTSADGTVYEIPANTYYVIGGSSDDWGTDIIDYFTILDNEEPAGE